MLQSLEEYICIYFIHITSNDSLSALGALGLSRFHRYPRGMVHMLRNSWELQETFPFIKTVKVGACLKMKWLFYFSGSLILYFANLNLISNPFGEFFISSSLLYNSSIFIWFFLKITFNIYIDSLCLVIHCFNIFL